MQPGRHPCMLLPEWVCARHWIWRIPLGGGISKFRACMFFILFELCICVSITVIRSL